MQFISFIKIFKIHSNWSQNSRRNKHFYEIVVHSRVSIVSFYLILVSVLAGYRFEILFKFSTVSRANKFSDKDELFYVFITAIAEIQATVFNLVPPLSSPSLFHILHYFVPFVSGFIISVLYTGWINASKRVIVIANNLRCAQSSVTIKLLTLH